MADGKVEYEVRADTSKLDGDLQSATKKIETESAKWGTAGSTAAGFIEKNFDSLIAKAIKLGEEFGKFVVQFIDQGIDMAADLKQIDEQSRLVFGEGAIQRIDRWAKSAASKYGLTEMAAKKYASSLGLLMKAAGATGDEAADMSEKLTSFIADFSAFKNVDTDTVFNAIRSALNGKTTAFANLSGLDLSDKVMKQIDSEWGDASLEYQRNFRYQAIMDYMNNLGINGFFAQQKGTTQNSQARIDAARENIQTNVGAAALPVKESAMESLADIMELLANAPIAITGTEQQLTEALGTYQESLDKIREMFSAEMEKFGEQFGYTKETYEKGGYSAEYGSYGQYVYSQVAQNAKFYGGEKSDQANAFLAQYNETFQSVAQVQQAVDNIKVQLSELEKIKTEAAYAAAKAEADAIAQGLSDGATNIQQQINNISTSLNQLSNYSGVYIPSHAIGLDYVPHDNYLAKLHEGESVLTAEEAKVWRNFKYGGISSSNTLNYDALGVTMRENVRAGGNVFLDGEIVGRVISAAQGNSYRAMERSGFQQ